MGDADIAAAQYDAMGAAYAAANTDNFYNALYERPAMVRLIGDIAGRDVLDAGCGPGALTETLLDAGARVTAVDVSAEMLRLASTRVGSRAQLVVADLAGPLPFADDSFDLIVASLVLHYLRDWEPVLTELRRVLRPAGRLVMSTHHPAMDWQAHSPDDYFAVKQVTETWKKAGTSYPVTFWRRPLRSMTGAIAAAGFAIHRLEEPHPEPSLRELDPKDHLRLSTQPAFLFFELRPDGRSAASLDDRVDAALDELVPRYSDVVRRLGEA